MFSRGELVMTELGNMTGRIVCKFQYFGREEFYYLIQSGTNRSNTLIFIAEECKLVAVLFERERYDQGLNKKPEGFLQVHPT